MPPPGGRRLVTFLGRQGPFLPYPRLLPPLLLLPGATGFHWSLLQNSRPHSDPGPHVTSRLKTTDYNLGAEGAWRHRVWKSCSLACGQASDVAAGPKLHLWHPRPQALMAWLSGVRVVCSGCTGHPRGLLSRACPMAQRQSPGGVASPWPPRPPQRFVTLVFCPQAAPLLKCPCWDCCPLFFTKVFLVVVFLSFFFF